jgi:hypothetical protein
MSSTYGLICLNHDPGIEIGDHTIDYQPDSMLAAARNPTGDWVEHARCDLVMAAYSYPIVRIACPGETVSGAGCGWHNQPRWVEAEWLRLLIAAYQAGGAVPEAVIEPFASRCWKRERALRLGPVLGLAGTQPAAEIAAEPPVGSVLTCPDGTSFTRLKSSGDSPSLWQWRTSGGSTYGVITWRLACAKASGIALAVGGDDD